jgi:hypothetical protein
LFWLLTLSQQTTQKRHETPSVLVDTFDGPDRFKVGTASQPIGQTSRLTSLYDLTDQRPEARRPRAVP